MNTSLQSSSSLLLVVWRAWLIGALPKLVVLRAIHYCLKFQSPCSWQQPWTKPHAMCSKSTCTLLQRCNFNAAKSTMPAKPAKQCTSAQLTPMKHTGSIPCDSDSDPLRYSDNAIVGSIVSYSRTVTSAIYTQSNLQCIESYEAC